MSLEHSDGSASAARLPRRAEASPPVTRLAAAAAEAAAGEVAAAEVAAGEAAAAESVGPRPGLPEAGAQRGGGSAAASGSEWLYYVGFGDRAEQLRKTRHRVEEVAAAVRVLEAVQRGRPEGLLELPPAVASSLAGRLDLGRLAAVGHSYGGATVAAAAASLPAVKCAVSLDPWWDCFEEEWPVLHRWAGGAPLLVVGSEDWNTPNAEGRLKCGGANQERVLAAAAAGGGGAVHLVPRGSTHASFDDLMLLYGKSVSWLLRSMGIRSSLEPRRAHEINTWCIAHFLSTHLPPPRQQPTAHSDPRVAAARAHAAAPAGAVSETSAGAGNCASANDLAAPLMSEDVVLTHGSVAEQEADQQTTPSARPVREADLEAYRKQLGEWAAMLRAVPGAAAGAAETEGEAGLR